MATWKPNLSLMIAVAAGSVLVAAESLMCESLLRQRATLVAEAEKLTAQQLPWIPDVQPDTVLLLGKGLTGALSSSAYLYSPWVNQLGGTG